MNLKELIENCSGGTRFEIHITSENKTINYNKYEPYNLKQILKIHGEREVKFIIAKGKDKFYIEVH